MNRYSERFKFLSKDGLSSASCVALTTDLSPSTMAFSDIRIVQTVFVLLSWHSSFSFGGEFLKCLYFQLVFSVSCTVYIAF